MSIWFTSPSLDTVNAMRPGNMMEHLDIRVTAIAEDALTGTMPVDHRTKQPHGLLHGGASVVLAETLGSIAANLVVDPANFYCVGLDINANHLRSVKNGLVTGTARAVHLGRSTQVWSIEIRDENGKLANISRLTMAVVPRPKTP